MTGFGSAEAKVAVIGRISVEIRSVNHKFLEVVSHLPEGFLSLEDDIRKAVEAKIKRGRVVCAVNIAEPQAGRVFLNERLAKNYLSALKKLQRRLQISDGISLETLIHLPGVVSAAENATTGERLWPHLKVLLGEALQELKATRLKEGRALGVFLKMRAKVLISSLEAIKKIFNKAITEKAGLIVGEEERLAFLKESDISEEIERLGFHIRNFVAKLSENAPVGKELDFIAQEMQREANTMGAKSFAAAISARVIRIKSEVEKIREQVQNIE